MRLSYLLYSVPPTFLSTSDLLEKICPRTARFHSPHPPYSIYLPPLLHLEFSLERQSNSTADWLPSLLEPGALRSGQVFPKRFFSNSASFVVVFSIACQFVLDKISIFMPFSFFKKKTFYAKFFHYDFSFFVFKKALYFLKDFFPPPMVLPFYFTLNSLSKKKTELLTLEWEVRGSGKVFQSRLEPPPPITVLSYVGQFWGWSVLFCF